MLIDIDRDDRTFQIIPLLTLSFNQEIMESPNPETGAIKRKRSPVDDAGAPRHIPHPPMGHGMGMGGAVAAGPAAVTRINYLMKARSERLRLIEGDSETFSDVLGMIDDYEGRSYALFLLFKCLSFLR